VHYRTLCAFLALPVCVLTLVACEAEVRQGPPIPPTMVPEELKDCSFHQLVTKYGQTIHAIRCPGSSTSASWKSGKTNMYATTVDNTAEKQKLEASIAETEAALAAAKAKLEALK
jgi:hypothetical protein